MGRFLEWYFGEKSTKRGKLREGNVNVNPPAGCMSAVFQLFDFQNLHVCFDQSVVAGGAGVDDRSFVNPENPKGVEAPRNSLETEEITITKSSDEISLPPMLKTEDIRLSVPMSIKINTKIEGSSSESSYSPSTKSPNLVARLMGLDLLPLENPRVSLSPSNRNANPLRISLMSSQNRMSRSLPESPRTSSERKSDADHNYHDGHRFSLQIIREKAAENDENKHVLNYSNRYNAKEIVKQVKENVGKRRVGMDITNRVLRNIAQERRDENLIGCTKSKKPSKSFVKVIDESTLQNAYPPRPRFSEHKVPRKPKQAISNDQQRQQQVHGYVHYVKINKEVIRKDPKERFRSRLGKPEKSRVEKPCNDRSNECFVGKSISSRTKCLDKKWQKIPLLNDNNLPQKQVANVRATKYGSQFKPEATTTTTPIFGALGNKDMNSTLGDRRLEYQYITNILRFVGIDKDTRPVSFPTCHALDPSIFNHVDLVFSTTTVTSDVKNNQSNQLRHRCNRRLLFSLVGEMISSILLRPLSNVIPLQEKLAFVASRSHETTRPGTTEVINGAMLVEELCAKIRSYPNAKCEDLNDIDALVGHDLHQSTLKFEGEDQDEEGSIVLGIETYIVESLVEELVGLMILRSHGQSRD